MRTKLFELRIRLFVEDPPPDLFGDPSKDVIENRTLDKLVYLRPRDDIPIVPATLQIKTGWIGLSQKTDGFAVYIKSLFKEAEYNLVNALYDYYITGDNPYLEGNDHGSEE